MLVWGVRHTCETVPQQELNAYFLLYETITMQPADVRYIAFLPNPVQ